MQATKSCLMVGAKRNCENVFKNISVFCPPRGPKFRKYDVLRKMLVLMLPIFICNYLTVIQYIIGKNPLNGRE